jgi:hypothetical protein
MAGRPPAALTAAKYVYVRRGGTIASFEPLYLGPFPVLDYRGPKVFRNAMSGKEESVSSLAAEVSPLVCQCAKVKYILTLISFA